MRLAMAALALAVAAATPAMAQNEGQLPTWSEGKWCTEPRPGMIACVVYEFRDGTMISSHVVTENGEESDRSSTTTRVENGRLVKRTPAAGTAFREVSQKPGELVMENIVPENIARGDARRITYRVKGDELTVEFSFDNQPNVVQRYRRTP